MGRKYLWLVIALFLISFVNAQSTKNIYSATDTPVITTTTGENSDWFYIKVDDGQSPNYIGINKNTRGIMGVGDATEFYGEIWLVPAFRHPINSEWYLCPIRNIETVNEFSDMGNGWYFDLSDSTTTCYQYTNLGTTANANLDIQLSFLADSTKTKININVTVNGVSPTDRGFAFIFFPENPAKYRYVMLNGNIYDLAGVVGSVPTDKVFEFLDSGQDQIGDTFDWLDMLDTGNRYAEILTVGGKKGLMVGTYGYGAGNFIEIDPAYNFTASATNPSWHLLNGSIENDTGINDYEDKINITAGISDGSSSTRYETRVGTNQVTNYYYQFNDYGQNILYDSSGNDNPLTLLPNADIKSYNDFYSFYTTENNGASAKSFTQPEFDISANDFTAGLIVKVDNSTGFTKYLLWHYSSPSGYYLYSGGSWYGRAYVRENDGTADALVGTTAINDGNPHSIVIRRNVTSGILQLLVDGNVEDSGINFDGSIGIGTYGDLEIGTRSTTSGFYGYIDEVFLTEEYLSDSVINDYTTNGYYYRKDKGNALQVFFNRAVDTAKSYSLRIDKYCCDTTTIRIYPMQDMADINQSNYIDTVISEGTNYVAINSLVYDGYNLPFRIATISADIEISDIYLYEIGNDTTPPEIFDCYVNDSFVDCNESVTWACHVSDDTDVATAYGRVRVVGTNHTITQQAFRNPSDPEIWEVVLTANQIQALFEAINWTFDSYLNISLDYVNATDLAGNNKENSSFDVWNIYSCILCTPNWIAQYNSCLTNDTRLKYYNDINNCSNTFGLPGDNGTYVSCNYCDADLYKDYTSECYHNGSYYVINYTWADNNYWSCCVITSLPIDCPTQYSPYNVSAQEYCTFTENDFEIDYDSEVYFGLTDDKVYWKFNLNDTNNSYKCISYVKTTSGNLLQVNPQYTAKSNTLIQFSNAEYESREAFVTQNGIGNVYFTKENLVIDGRLYVFGVECSGNSQTIKSERLVSVLYESVNAPVTRWFWIKENLVSIILFMFIVIIITLIIAGLWRFRK